MDSLILCKFLRGVFTDPFTEWALAVRGDRLGRRRAELRQTARRIVLAKRVYNSREGWRPADDWLPRKGRRASRSGSPQAGRPGSARPGSGP